jgi:hypothetical protein
MDRADERALLAGVWGQGQSRGRYFQRFSLGRLLLVDPVSRRSEFDRLKDVAKAASLNRFKERLGLLADIDALGPSEVWLEGVPSGKIAHFAGEARVTDVADLRKVLVEDKRRTLIVSLVRAGRPSRQVSVIATRADYFATPTASWPRPAATPAPVSTPAQGPIACGSARHAAVQVGVTPGLAPE